MEFFFVVLLFFVVLGILAFIGFRVCKRKKPLGKKARLLAVATYVILMGAMSVFWSMIGSFNTLAVWLGIAVFIVQWRYIFGSAWFARNWQRRLFRWVFIINSAIRLPISFFLDMFIYAGLESLYFYFQTEQTILTPTPFSQEEDFMFLPTFVLTIVHGIAVQLFYALTFALLYVIGAFITKLMRRYA